MPAMSKVGVWLEAMNRIDDAVAAAKRLQPPEWRATCSDATAVILAPDGRVHVFGSADHVAPVLVPGDARALARWILEQFGESQ
jgi:hypothetical protein